MSGVLGDTGLALIRLSKYEEESGRELARLRDITDSVQTVIPVLSGVWRRMGCA